MDERVLLPAEQRQVIHEYGEPLDAEMKCIPSERSLPKSCERSCNRRKCSRESWSRSRARDYYDLWRVLGTYGDQMDLASFDSLLREKCAVRAVSFAGPDEFFHDRMLAFVEETWEQSLGPLVPDLPIFETVISELRPQVAQLVRPGGT